MDGGESAEVSTRKTEQIFGNRSDLRRLGDC
jgi:hypothetical protein